MISLFKLATDKPTIAIRALFTKIVETVRVRILFFLQTGTSVIGHYRVLIWDHILH